MRHETYYCRRRYFTITPLDEGIAPWALACREKRADAISAARDELPMRLDDAACRRLSRHSARRRDVSLAILAAKTAALRYAT